MTSGGFSVPVDSEPPGAAVRIDGLVVGTTPCTVVLTRSQRRFELQLPGYQQQPVEVGLVRNMWVAGNTLTLGLGVLVDVGLGTDRAVYTDPIRVYLSPGSGAAPMAWSRPREDGGSGGCGSRGEEWRGLVDGLGALIERRWR